MRISFISALFCFAVQAISGTASCQSENSLLWKIEGNGIHTSYVFGTIHLIPAEHFILKKKVLKAMKKSDQLVMEIDLSDPDMGKDLLCGLFMDNDSTLDQLMSPKDFLLLDSILLKNTGMGAKFYNRWKPLLVSAALEPMVDSNGESVSYETELMEIAEQRKMKIAGLESVGEQLAVFDSIPYSYQVQGIIDCLHAWPETEVALDELVDLYMQEDMSAMFDLSIGFFETGVIRKYLLDQRNINWIERIHSLATNEKTFFAVGAAHLGGEIGILRLLQDAGYKVIPILD